VSVDDQSTVTSATPAVVPGFVLTRFADTYGRRGAGGCAAAAGVGQPQAARGRIACTPTFYAKLYVDLRAELAAVAVAARQAGLGVWAQDATLPGFKLTSRARAEVSAVTADPLTSTGARIPVRPSRAKRLWVLGFAAVWCGSVAVIAVREFADRPGWFIARLVGIVAGAWMSRRLAYLRLDIDCDQLVVRNTFTTHRLHRAQIAGISFEPPATAPLIGGWLPGPRGAAITIRTARKAIVADVSRRWPGFGNDRHELEAVTRALDLWRKGGGPAAPRRPGP